MSFKVMFQQSVKYNGKRYAGNVVFEANEADKESLLNAGAFEVKNALIGEAKSGHKIIIPIEADKTAVKQAETSDMGKEAAGADKSTKKAGKPFKKGK